MTRIHPLVAGLAASLAALVALPTPAAEAEADAGVPSLFAEEIAPGVFRSRPADRLVIDPAHAEAPAWRAGALSPADLELPADRILDPDRAELPRERFATLSELTRLGPVESLALVDTSEATATERIAPPRRAPHAEQVMLLSSGRRPAR